MCDCRAAQQRAGNVILNFDLAELRGYKYQTGMVFAVFMPGCGQEIARGGRYDAVGEVFGRARPATGFSTDLKTLMNLSQRDFGRAARGDPGACGRRCHYCVRRSMELRRAGERVVSALPGQTGDAGDHGLRPRAGRIDKGWLGNQAGAVRAN